LLETQVDSSLSPGSPATTGVPRSSIQYLGQLYVFNNGLIQIASNSSGQQLVLEQQADNSVALKPFSGIPQQYWMRAHPFKNDTTATIDLPPSPKAINVTPEFMGCNIVDGQKSLVDYVSQFIFCLNEFISRNKTIVLVPASDNSQALSVKDGQLQPSSPAIVEPISGQPIQTFILFACKDRYFLLQNSVNPSYILQVKY